MRKSVLLVLSLFLVGLLFARSEAQTTYTVVQNSCGAKNLGYCTMNVTDQTNAPYQIIVDHRSNSQGFLNTLTIQTPVFPSTILYEDHATLEGFVDVPPSHTDVNGTLTVDTDDGHTHAVLNYVAHYVWICSGRGCAGTQIGWHYVVQAGSTVTVQ